MENNFYYHSRPYVFFMKVHILLHDWYYMRPIFIKTKIKYNYLGLTKRRNKLRELL